MNKLCDNVQLYIYRFLSCKENIKMKSINRNNNIIIRCKSHSYKDLYGCLTHVYDCNVSYVIYILNNEEKKYKLCKFTDVIHFGSCMQMRIASKYLNNFGNISHYCCGGKGVMFKDNSINKANRLSSTYYLNNSTSTNTLSDIYL